VTLVPAVAVAQLFKGAHQIGNQHLHDGIDRLLAGHDDHQLHAELHEAAAGITFFLAEAQHAIVLGRIANELALQEGNVEERGVVIDKLEHIVFDC